MKASHGPRACYTLLGRGQARAYHPASVQIGEHGAPRPLPQVKSTIGQDWVPYHQLVENRSGAKSVDAEVFREMLDKAGLSLNSFATESRRDFGQRSLYVALGNDLPSAVLLASAQNWVEVTRPGVVLKPMQVRLPLPGWFGVQNVVREFWKERGLTVLDLYPKPADYEQVASVYPEPIDWDTVGHKDPRVSLLVRWVLFRTVRLQERHPYGASILLGTNLDRNLQRIADALVPNDAPLGRNRRAGELWDLSMEPTTFQLPVVDTVHADWKTGHVTCHRPLLALTIAQIENTAGIYLLDKLAPLLSKPPPVYLRLAKDQSRELLQLAKRCHVRTRAMRKVAQEFIQKSCRLDYKMGWSTLNARAVADLPEDALLLVIAALVGFSSNVAGEDWLKNPPDSIRELVPIVKQVSQKLPASPVLRIKGTNAALVYNTPYEPVLSADVDVFSFVASPDAFPEAIELRDWSSKSDSHPHPPTKCFTGTTYGRWLVQLFTTPERRQKNEDSGRTFWVTHLREYDDPWWGQVSNGARFTTYLKRETHDAALQDGSSPSRPAPLLLRDVPLVLSGTAGLAGPTEDGEDVPEGASHLQVVACPPFGFWAAQMRNHVWQGVSPVVNKAPGHIQRLHVCLAVHARRPPHTHTHTAPLPLQWLVEFLPKPGLLGPLFVPIDRQVAQHV